MVNQTNFKPLSVQLGSVDEKNAEQFVIGRDHIVESFWKSVQSASIRVLAERRMGKTWVLKLALARKPQWVVAHLFDVQQYDNAAEFVLAFNKELHKGNLISDKWFNKVQDWFRRFYQKLQGLKVGPIPIPELDSWVTLLKDTFNHMTSHNGNFQVAIIFDELPFFLDKLIKANHANEAIQLLDTFRALRHENTSLRLVFCGSLGLHIVLEKLHDIKYTGQPINDMPPFEVPPLSPDDAQYLSGCLLIGENIKCTDINAVAQAIAEGSCGVPFYIQHFIRWMAGRKEEIWSPEKALAIPEELFNAPGDPVEFSYYSSRLEDYYTEDIVEKARAVLDVLSRKAEGLPFNDIINLIRHRPSTLTVSPEQILKVIQILRDDHYMEGTGDNWRFKLDIVRQWWFETRGRLAL
jgi:hypothetical protein